MTSKGFNISKFRQNRDLEMIQNQHIGPVAISLSMLIFLINIIGLIIMQSQGVSSNWIGAYFVVTLLLGLYVMFALKVAKQWEKGVVLRLGKFRTLSGPGVFWIIPIIDSVTEWIDHRVMVSPFSVEKTLTKDTVPVDVDAVLFWAVWDAEKAALEVEDYRTAITWASQTALREVIGALN
ncbi:MAG: SPFH domain-containing protein, partial [Chloroflexota bacterium]